MYRRRPKREPRRRNRGVGMTSGWSEESCSRRRARIISTTSCPFDCRVAPRSPDTSSGLGRLGAPSAGSGAVTPRPPPVAADVHGVLESLKDSRPNSDVHPSQTTSP